MWLAMKVIEKLKQIVLKQSNTKIESISYNREIFLKC
jgi:hypothetical protein